MTKATQDLQDEPLFWMRGRSLDVEGSPQDRLSAQRIGLFAVRGRVRTGSYKALLRAFRSVIDLIAAVWLSLLGLPAQPAWADVTIRFENVSSGLKMSYSGIGTEFMQAGTSGLGQFSGKIDFEQIGGMSRIDGQLGYSYQF